MPFSITIPTTKKSTCIRLCLKSIFEYNSGCDDIILVNNATDPISLEDYDLSLEHKKHVRVFNIHSRKNSIAKSWNIGIMHSKNDIILVSNDDVVYSPGSLEALCEEFLVSNNRIVCPVDFYAFFCNKDRMFSKLPDSLEREMENKKFYTHYNFLHADRDQNVLSVQDIHNSSRGRTAIPSEVIEAVYGSIDNMCDLWERLKQYVINYDSLKDYQMGFSFMLSKQIVERVGMFDENFEIGYWEDVDYKNRAKYEGIEWNTTDKSYVHHIGSCTFLKSAFTGAAHFHNRNKEFLWQKQGRYYTDMEFKISISDSRREEYSADLSKLKRLSLLIEPNQNNLSGNALCFNNFMGDPLFYLWAECNEHGISLRHGYHSNEVWNTFDDYTQDGWEKITYEIIDGKSISINGNVVRELPPIETYFVSLGDSRGMTPNTDCAIKLENLDAT